MLRTCQLIDNFDWDKTGKPSQNKPLVISRIKDEKAKKNVKINKVKKMKA